MSKTGNSQKIKYLLIRWSELTIQKLNTAPIAEWSDNDYFNLSVHIWRKSRIKISKNTLKRAFGKIKTDESYVPQLATLDALAKFLDYVNWTEFETAFIAGFQVPQPVKISSNTRDLKPYKLKLLFALIGLCAVAIYIYIKDRNHLKADIRITCENPNGYDHHTAIFKLLNFSDVQEIKDFQIDFNDGQTEQLKSHQNTLTHYFYTPGCYTVKLLFKQKVIDSTSITVKSKGWMGYAYSQKFYNGRQRLILPDSSLNSLSGYSMVKIARLGIDTSSQFFVTMVNIKSSTINGDNFDLKTSVIAKSRIDNGLCSQFNIRIYGQSNSHYVGIINKECIAWADANFSEQIKSGLENNLSGLAVNLSKDTKVNLTVKNKRVLLYINAKLVYSTTYLQPIGKIRGVKLFFSGLGEIKSFNLTDLKTKLVY